jgi:hypothetical protein
MAIFILVSYQPLLLIHPVMVTGNDGAITRVRFAVAEPESE